MVTLNLLPPNLLTALIVDDVLSSYTLARARAERIRTLAESRFHDRPDLEAIYLFVDSLVERGVRPEDFLRSLRPLENLPSPSPGPLELLVRRERGAPLSYGGIVAVLAERLGTEPAVTLEEILRGADIAPASESPVTRAELEENLDRVRERLGQLRDRLDRCGVLAPPRRVGRVSFGKVNLFEYTGRYVSLITDAVAVRIFEAHRKGLSQNGAAGFAGVSKDTVKRWWSSAGLASTRRRHNALDADRLAAVLEAHRAHGGNASSAARALGVAASTVARHWKAAGLAPQGRPGALDGDAHGRVREAHRRFGGNATAAARALALAPSTVRKHWKRAGLAPRAPGRPRRR